MDDLDCRNYAFYVKIIKLCVILGVDFMNNF